MANRDLLAIGTSAGGVEALRNLVGGLPADLPAAVLIVIHLSEQFPSRLDAILAAAGPLPVAFAEHDQAVERGRIYIAPPGRHLLVAGDRLYLGNGAPENRARPAVDPLLRSLAVCCGSRTIGVILTGSLNGGSSGLRTLKNCGGIAVVQDPEDALYSDMPRAALERVTPDHVVPLTEMARLLARLVQQPAGKAIRAPENVRLEVEIAAKGRGSMDEMDKIRQRSRFTCPDCQGVLWHIDEGGLVRYRCHVGHSYTAEVLDCALGDHLVRALASALRALEERAALLRSLEKNARDGRRNRMAVQWAEKARVTEAEAETVRRSLHALNEVIPEAAA